MQLTRTFLSVALATFAAAQGITDIPQCSLLCLQPAVESTNCELTDFACSCGQAPALLGSITPCVQAACSAEDQARVTEVLGGICASAGVPISIPAEASATPSTPADSSAVVTSAVAETTVSGIIVPSANGTASVTRGTPTGADSTPTDASASTSPSQGAAVKFGVGAAGLFAGLAYVL